MPSNLFYPTFTSHEVTASPRLCEVSSLSGVFFIRRQPTWCGGFVLPVCDVGFIVSWVTVCTCWWFQNGQEIDSRHSKASKFQQISETVWRAFSPLELQVSSKNIFKNVVRYVRWFGFALSFWVNADEFVLSHPLERNNVLMCDSHFNILVLIGCLLVICLFVCLLTEHLNVHCKNLNVII